LGRRYAFRRQMTSDRDGDRFKRPVQRVLRQDFKLHELQSREHNLLRRTLMVKLSDDLPVATLSETQLICRVAVDNRGGAFLIDSAPGEHRQCRQLIGFADGELRAPQWSLHVERQAV